MVEEVLCALYRSWLLYTVSLFIRLYMLQTLFALCIIEDQACLLMVGRLANLRLLMFWESQVAKCATGNGEIFAKIYLLHAIIHILQNNENYKWLELDSGWNKRRLEIESLKRWLELAICPVDRQVHFKSNFAIHIFGFRQSNACCTVSYWQSSLAA